MGVREKQCWVGELGLCVEELERDMEGEVSIVDSRQAFVCEYSAELERWHGNRER